MLYYIYIIMHGVKKIFYITQSKFIVIYIYAIINECAEEHSYFLRAYYTSIIHCLNRVLVSTDTQLCHAESCSIRRLGGYTTSVHTTGMLFQTLGGNIVILFVEAPQTLSRCARTWPNPRMHVISENK